MFVEVEEGRQDRDREEAVRVALCQVEHGLFNQIHS